MIVNAAIVQARPVYYNLDASLERAQTLTSDAARAGAQLVAFGETWLPGYPAWLDVCPGAALWDSAATKSLFADLVANSPTVPGPATEALAQLARELGIVLVMGLNERCGNTLYNSLLTFDADGALRNHHRKLRPTYTERLVWGPGDGAGLRAPETAAGRLGALVCWEHWMPLPRQTLHDAGEQIHVAAWPTVRDMHQVASRHYAFEGRCFVLAAGSLLRVSDLPPGLETLPELTPNDLLLRGGSAIYGPDGVALAGPSFDEETILHAHLDLRQIARESMTLDVSGHYARPDVFSLTVNRSRPGAADPTPRD
ncbi:MAG: carbon-nitrogen hydrolase family protein [Anaerolineaceae bacterium]|nr:carbon-nitrogen hydrolase family protein [Anaerolineaceae bacterium]MCY4022209.1 carbon-nitrogen hydrolase family protein [Anaerolineaceae bacterium]